MTENPTSLKSGLTPILAILATIVVALIALIGNWNNTTTAADTAKTVAYAPIAATLTAEAKVTLLAASKTPTISPNWTPVALPTSTPAPSPSASPLIPTSTPDPTYGTKLKVDTAIGRLSIYKHQAISAYLRYSKEDTGKNLCVYVESYGHPMRIELWVGSIPWEDTSWWGNFHMIAQDPPDVNWQSKVNPKLSFSIVPGDYTLFIIRWIPEDQASSIIIDYNISLVTTSCPQNFPR